MAIVSCRKDKSYFEVYNCEVEYRYHELGSIPIDSTYLENLKVIPDLENILIFNNSIPTDSLIGGNWYWHSSYPNIFRIKVMADSMYVYKWSGGQGGGTKRNYSCLREKVK